jgi:RND family efflux transporter MFP subunit
MTIKISRRTLLLVLGAVAALTAGVLWILRPGQPVETLTVEQGELDQRVRGPAKVQARVPVTLGARVTAEVIAIAADIGDQVRKGQPLVRLDDRDLRARVSTARAALTRAKADLALAESNERRDREVFGKGYGSLAALDATTAQRAVKQAEVAAAEQELAYAETQATYANLVSPMDSVVVARLAEPGDTVAPGTPILRLVDPATLQAVARIDETEAGRIQPGMPALIRLRAGGEVPGKVARIRLEADAAARELEVEVAFDVPLERFAIDQEALVEIRVGRARGLVIPLTALIRVEGQPGVLAVRDGHARFQPVEVGAIDASRLIVSAGLQAGEVIVRKAQGVRPGARVQVIMGKGGGRGPSH